MLQIDVCTFASDALEDAMRLAQTKSLNSYNFSDCLSFLNYVWADIYKQICMVDSGYYTKTVRLTEKLTRLPKFVMNTITVYHAQRPTDYNRILYRSSGMSELKSANTYHVSGTDLWCPDAVRRTVWLEYCPQAPQIFFTHHNRDPKIWPDGHDSKRESLLGLYKLVGMKDGKEIDVSDMTVSQDTISSCQSWVLRHRNLAAGIPDEDVTEHLIREADEGGVWQLKYASCDFPYVFCSYQHDVTGEWHSGFFTKDWEWTDFDPFGFTGRNSNIEYLDCKWNDKTGMGVIVRDWNDFDKKLLNIDKLPEKANTILLVENDFEYRATDEVVYKFSQGYWYTKFDTDYNYEKVQTVSAFPAAPDVNDVVLFNSVLYKYDGDKWQVTDGAVKVAQEQTAPKVKELGWTPDTKLVYPAPEVYRYLVARLAEKFSALNESNIMGVQSELADSRFAFQAFLRKDKSAWERMRNVNLPTVTDWL